MKVIMIIYKTTDVHNRRNIKKRKKPSRSHSILVCHNDMVKKTFWRVSVNYK